MGLTFPSAGLSPSSTDLSSPSTGLSPPSTGLSLTQSKALFRLGTPRGLVALGTPRGLVAVGTWRGLMGLRTQKGLVALALVGKDSQADSGEFPCPHSSQSKWTGSRPVFWMWFPTVEGSTRGMQFHLS